MLCSVTVAKTATDSADGWKVASKENQRPGIGTGLAGRVGDPRSKAGGGALQSNTKEQKDPAGSAFLALLGSCDLGSWVRTSAQKRRLAQPLWLHRDWNSGRKKARKKLPGSERPGPCQRNASSGPGPSGLLAPETDTRRKSTEICPKKERGAPDILGHVGEGPLFLGPTSWPPARP